MKALAPALVEQEIRVWYTGAKREWEPDIEGTFVKYTPMTPGYSGIIHMKNCLLSDGRWKDEHDIPLSMFQWFEPKKKPPVIPTEQWKVKEISPGRLEVEVSIEGFIVTNPKDKEEGEAGREDPGLTG